MFCEGPAHYARVALMLVNESVQIAQQVFVFGHELLDANRADNSAIAVVYVLDEIVVSNGMPAYAMRFLIFCNTIKDPLVDGSLQVGLLNAQAQELVAKLLERHRAF